jgi:hypothetical protein
VQVADKHKFDEARGHLRRPEQRADGDDDRRFAPEPLKDRQEVRCQADGTKP